MLWNTSQASLIARIVTYFDYHKLRVVFRLQIIFTRFVCLLISLHIFRGGVGPSGSLPRELLSLCSVLTVFNKLLLK